MLVIKRVRMYPDILTLWAHLDLNQVGTITSKVSMYANKYPLDDAIKLFGAIDGYGAQKNKIKIFIP